MTENLHAHGERRVGAWFTHEFESKKSQTPCMSKSLRTDGARFTPKFVPNLKIIYPQIATEPGPRRDLGEEHNTVQNDSSDRLFLNDTVFLINIYF